MTKFMQLIHSEKYIYVGIYSSKTKEISLDECKITYVLIEIWRTNQQQMPTFGVNFSQLFGWLVVSSILALHVKVSLN